MHRIMKCTYWPLAALVMGIVQLSCAADDPDLDSNTQTLAGSPGVPVGTQDVPLPGSEALPPSAEGDPISDPPPDDATRAKQQQYLRALGERIPRWRSDRVDEAEIEIRSMQLKREILGE